MKVKTIFKFIYIYCSKCFFCWFSQLNLFRLRNMKVAWNSQDMHKLGN